MLCTAGCVVWFVPCHAAVASRYSIVQVGVTLFTPKEGTTPTEYEARPFNFYTFPAKDCK